MSKRFATATTSPPDTLTAKNAAYTGINAAMTVADPITEP